jgi:predicted phage-related endonuclease
MSQYLYDIEQNTDNWLRAKLGKFSASSAAALLMKDSTEGYKNLTKKIIEERLTGREAEGKWNGNQHTQRGHELEPIAIENYELSTFTKVHKVGLVVMNDWTCCSPDGLIGNNGLIQVKCPIFSTQLDYIESQKVPTDYYKQMQFELMVTEREYNIFYSFHPDLPTVEIKLERDEKLIQEIIEKLEVSINLVQEKINQIRSN